MPRVTFSTHEEEFNTGTYLKRLFLYLAARTMSKPGVIKILFLFLAIATFLQENAKVLFHEYGERGMILVTALFESRYYFSLRICYNI